MAFSCLEAEQFSSFVIQALFYHLRLTREDNFAARKAAAIYAARNPSAAGHQPNGQQANHPPSEQTGDHQAVNGAQQHLDHTGRQPGEHIEEVVQILKTAFPLLTVAMETMVDQIQGKFKASFEEDVYRHICLLMHEAVAVSYSTCYTSRIPHNPDPSNLLSE